MQKAQNLLRTNLENKLKRRGWIKTINNITVQSPRREFKTMSEEIIWALNESGTPLSVNDLCYYLDSNQKTIRKALKKLNDYPLGNKIITKTKDGKKTVYNINIGKKLDIKTVFHMIKLS